MPETNGHSECIDIVHHYIWTKGAESYRTSSIEILRAYAEGLHKIRTGRFSIPQHAATPNITETYQDENAGGSDAGTSSDLCTIKFSWKSPDLSYFSRDDVGNSLFVEVCYTQPPENARAKFLTYFHLEDTKVGLRVQLPYERKEKKKENKKKNKTKNTTKKQKEKGTITVYRRNSIGTIDETHHGFNEHSSEVIKFSLDDFGRSQPLWDRNTREIAQIRVSIANLTKDLLQAKSQCEEREKRAKEHLKTYKPSPSLLNVKFTQETESDECKSDSSANNTNGSDSDYEPDGAATRVAR
ncbi:hypothetical protein MMC13_001137 [Lambiella insularis]|nr:hypothetical protein [Lambiella insularis]